MISRSDALVAILVLIAALQASGFFYGLVDGAMKAPVETTPLMPVYRIGYAAGGHLCFR